MATAATRVPGISLIGLDVDQDALAAASSWLHEIGAQHELLCGRKVAALVAQSPLVRTEVDAHVLIATDLEGPGQRRVDDMVATVRRAVALGEVDVAPEDVDRWVGELSAADEGGRFFYSQTAYIVTAEKR